MIATEGALGRVFVLRLEEGDRLPDCVEQFAAEKGIHGGFCALLGGIGSGKLVVGPEDKDASPVTPILQHIQNVHEAAALGTIFPSEDGTPRLHMHAALGRDGNTHTGCIRTGIDVWKICEVVILEIPGTGMIRKKDRSMGFEVLSTE
jgi:predicted DNA-binding protein with PD1-like motif